jgi:hypothetical protein
MQCMFNTAPETYLEMSQVQAVSKVPTQCLDLTEVIL